MIITKKQTLTFEEENYESDYEILEILLKRKIKNVQSQILV
jgi:hypothetical protein